MMQILLIAAVVVGLAVAGLAMYINAQSGEFRVARSATMAAPPAAVFDQVNNFHNWNAWNPWIKLDPTAKLTYEGPESGEGAQYAWIGNKNVGEGRMVITESQPHDRIKIRLEFLKPMKATNTAEFTFAPEGDGTKVTWSMYGTNDKFMGKAFQTFMNMDKMIGGNFEDGLAAMKATVESAAS